MTLLRDAEHTALSQIELTGNFVDLGGDTRSSYRNLFKGSFTLATVNIAEETKPTIVADLEKALPINDAKHDGALLINVLEHIFNYRELLTETERILVPGAKIVIVVPYLFPYHASPDDYFRYSASALRRMLESFSNVQVVSLGSGVFAARYVLLERLLPGKVQDVFGIVLHPLASLCDALFTGLAHMLGKKYDPADYALGFVVTAHKPL
jgi:SAM-dependent methyltransferase